MSGFLKYKQLSRIAIDEIVCYCVPDAEEIEGSGLDNEKFYIFFDIKNHHNEFIWVFETEEERNHVFDAIDKKLLPAVPLCQEDLFY